MTDQEPANQRKICVACGKEYTGDLTACPNDGTTLTPLKDNNLVGDVLGDRYEILELIGDGAMGQVYKAKHKLLKRIVAVKMMHPNLVSGAAALKRFQKEAELASALNHPNILTVYDFGVTDNGVPYLVMAYLEGTSLSSEVAGGTNLDLKRSVHIFKQVSLGLAHAHEHGVVHRDLKPSNIMLVKLDNDPDFVKIVDFGIAKLLTPGEGETDNLTRTGEVFGSPPYMSPEQCRALSVDARSDIYSLGCVMYRTVSGKQPITGHDLIEYLYKHVNETPESFSLVCPELNIPKELETIIFKALAKKPEDRFQSMQELRAALDDIYQTIPGESMTRTDIPRLEMPDKDDTAGNAGHISSPGVSVSLGSSSIPPSSQAAENAEKAAAEIDAAAEANATANSTSNSTASPVVSPAASSIIPAAASATAPGVTVAVPVSLHSDKADVPKPKPSSTAVNISVHSPPPPGTNAAIAPVSPLQKLLKQKPLVLGAAGLILLGITFAVLKNSGSNPSEQEIEKMQLDVQTDYNKGLYALAKQKIRTAIKLAEKINSPKNAGNRYLLGMIQYAQGEYEDAQANLETAKSIYMANGNDPQRVAECEAFIGRADTALGQYDDAEKELQHSLALRSQLSGDVKSTTVADSLTGLAYLHMRQNKNKDAINELRDALALTEKTSGADSQNTASALNDLGQAYQLARNYKEAEPLYKRALSIRKNKLDGNSPFIADSYNCLGALCASTGRLKEASAYYQQALAIQQRALAPNDPRLAQTRQQYADLILRMHRR